jgi:hypothetical protein
MIYCVNKYENIIWKEINNYILKSNSKQNIIYKIIKPYKQCIQNTYQYKLYVVENIFFLFYIERKIINKLKTKYTKGIHMQTKSWKKPQKYRENDRINNIFLKTVKCHITEHFKMFKNENKTKKYTQKHSDIINTQAKQTAYFLDIQRHEGTSINIKTQNLTNDTKC